MIVINDNELKKFALDVKQRAEMCKKTKYTMPVEAILPARLVTGNRAKNDSNYTELLEQIIVRFVEIDL